MKQTDPTSPCEFTNKQFLHTASQYSRYPQPPLITSMFARLLSVNVGLPRDITWRGETVHTGIWKQPAKGRLMVHRLNLVGDGQGDLAGHGGEQRAVLVYQTDSYRYWESQLHRDNLTFGQFGENFTVDRLA